MLSSATDAIVHSHTGFGFHAKSEILEVWPPWMNISSGGPSLASSSVCGSPILLTSQIMRRRSAPQELKIVSQCGLQHTWKISSVWWSSVCSGVARFRRSCSSTVLSAEPVMSTYSWKGLNARQFTSALCDSQLLLSPLPLARVSQMRSCLSSPTEPNMVGCLQCHATSSTLPLWCAKVLSASNVLLPLLMSRMSHRQICLSSEPLSRWPSWRGLHARP
mmetsp:Transcript_28063/g.72772  ORF Transcript_28063/g.72772 Transcript_28063/m.72772 type:complete len:219 (+) Transcript_28063:223-879(+)